jgi:hypothetical protein
MSSQSGRDALHEILESLRTSLVSKEAFDLMQDKFLELARRQKNLEDRDLWPCRRLELLENKDLEYFERQRTFEEEIAASKSEIKDLKAELHNLTWSIQDMKTQELDRLYEVRDLKDMIEAAVGRTSHLEEELEKLKSTNEDLVQRLDSMQEASNSKTAAESKIKWLETMLMVAREEHREFKYRVEQVIRVPDRIRETSEDVTPEQGQVPSLLQLGDQVHQQDSQLDHEVYDHQEEVQDSESEDDIAAYNFRHRGDFENNNYDDEAMDHQVQYDPAILGDHDEEMDDTDFTIWLDDNGDLQTDYPYDDDAWQRLEATWAAQKRDFKVQAAEKKVDWLSVDLNKNSMKCLWTAMFPRTQKWTKADPGEYACSNCTNTQRICFGERDGRFEALPLLSDAIRKDTPTIMQLYVAEKEKVTRAYKCGHLWRD